MQTTKLHFRMQYVITSINKLDEPRKFTVGEYLIIFNGLPESIRQSYPDGCIFSEIRISKGPPDNVSEFIDMDFDGKYPPLEQELTVTGDRNGKQEVVFEDHPTELIAWCAQVQQDACLVLKRFIGCLRWRYNTTGPELVIWSNLSSKYSKTGGDSKQEWRDISE